MLPQKKLNLASFLKLEVMPFRGQVFTVYDLIKYVANYAGYVHKGEPDTPETKALEQAGLTIQLVEMPSVIQALLGISKVVLSACEPLYQKHRA